jgi:hypothetical protein
MRTSSRVQQPKRRHDRRADGSERERMREAAMMFNREEWISRAANEYIGIWGDRRQRASDGSATSQPPAKRGVTKACTEERVGERIQPAEEIARLPRWQRAMRLLGQSKSS